MSVSRRVALMAAVTTGSAIAGGVWPDGQRRRALRIADEFYRALRAKDLRAFERLWTPDAVYHVPVTVDGVPGALEGRDAIVAGLRDFFQLFGTVRATWKLEPMHDPRRVLAHWTLDIDLVAGGTYANRGVAMFQLRGDRIEDFSEHFDTAAFLRTFA